MNAKLPFSDLSTAFDTLDHNTNKTMVYTTFYSHASKVIDRMTYMLIWLWYFKAFNHPDSKVHGANMGHTLVLSAPAGPHVGPINFAIWAPL